MTERIADTTSTSEVHKSTASDKQFHDTTDVFTTNRIDVTYGKDSSGNPIHLIATQMEEPEFPYQRADRAEAYVITSTKR